MTRRLAVFFTLLVFAGTVLARGPAPFGEIAVAALPAEARATLVLVKAGGPFPYAKDGAVFGNRERLLPSRKRGYYREYTVKTRGAPHRRRCRCGRRRAHFQRVLLQRRSLQLVQAHP